MKVLCHDCYKIGRIDKVQIIKQLSKEALITLENAKKCEKCGREFKDENDKILVI